MAKKRESSELGLPADIPQGSPTPYLHPDQHSWILQSVGEMRESIGGLKSSVEMLIAQTKTQSEKINSLSNKVYLAGGIIGVVVVGIGWLIANFSSIRTVIELLSRTPPP